MSKYIVVPSKLYGKVVVPASKSDAQRAVLISSLTKGTSSIYHVGESDDVLAVISAIQTLGATVKKHSDHIEITGITSIDEPKVIDINESGLSSRMLGSIVSLFDQKIRIQAAGSLQKRPMHFFDEVLTQLYVDIKSTDGHFPITFKGPLQAGSISFDASISSQFLSGLLVALSQVNGNSHLNVKNLNSKPYIDMTLETLQAFGVQIENDNYRDFFIKGKQILNPTEYHVEGDWSAASYWFVAAALGHSIKIENLNPDSFQADKRIIDILRLANCEVYENDGTYTVNGEHRSAFNADLTECPDLFPSIAVLAALTPGKTTLKGSNRLIHKESNRAEAIKNELSKVGCKVILHENMMEITGINHPKSAEFETYGDHRMAMSLAILSLFCEGESSIKNTSVVTKSYPDFWRDFEALKKGN